MDSISPEDVVSYVEENISSFHKKRIQSLDNLKLLRVLSRKNPYLFRAKHLLTAEAIVRKLVDAHISSNEETLFGDWLEGLAIFINEKVYGGWKSGITGIDLEFDKGNVRHIVSVKSGPNWGNSSQIAKMKTDFQKARRALRTSNSRLHIIAVNGCCYGKNKTPDKGDYFKYCGQQFWEFISGEPELYTDIVEPLGWKAKEKNEQFLESYAAMINVFTREFNEQFCTSKGAIDWIKLVELNSKSD